MYDDIAEFKRFYQARLGQMVADLIRRQLDLFWHAIIHSNGDIHNLELVQASGSALGISLLGTVDKKQRVLDVSGNLIPAKLISNIIGSVPLVAEILTGIDRTGLFVTQFSMQGSIDDPEVDVNALALVPGLLRDVFSPNWLGEERDRIFGVEGAN